MIKYSVVIPVYNEEESVRPLAESVKDTMDALREPYEIIFVNDGSTDGTLQNLKKLGMTNSNLKIITLEQNSGQTVSLRVGFHAANGQAIVSMDGDLQNDPRDIPLLLNRLKEGYDAVCGWRRVRHDSLWKKGSSKIANMIQGLVFKSNLHDISCTLRAYKKDALKDIDLSWNGAHRFLPYLLLRNKKNIAEAEVRHRPRRFGKSKYNPAKIFKTSLDFLKLLLSRKT